MSDRENINPAWPVQPKNDSYASEAAPPLTPWNRLSGSSSSSSSEPELPEPSTPPSKDLAYNDLAEDIPVKIQDTEDDDTTEYESAREDENDNDDTLSGSVIEDIADEMGKVDLNRSLSNATNASTCSAKTNRSAKSALSVKFASGSKTGGLGVHNGDLVEQIRYSDLNRSLSSATDASVSSAKTNKSAMSGKSAVSVRVVGSFRLGTLGVQNKDPEEEEASAQRCLRSGDVVVISDVPAGAIVGYDTISFTVQEPKSFQGIRELPAGVHFVWGGATSPIGPRNGYWYISPHRGTYEPGQCHVLAWNRFSDTLEEQVVLAEKRIQKNEVAKVYDSCFPYNLNAAVTSAGGSSDSLVTGIADDAQMWDDLTCAIRGAVLTRITGKPWNEWTVTSSCDSKPTSEVPFRDSERAAFDHQAQLRKAMNFYEPTLNFAFNRGPSKFTNETAGRQRTERVIDSSTYINKVISEKCINQNPEEVVAEMQFCYISGTFLGNMNCIKQFGIIAKVVLRAYKWCFEQPAVSAKFLRALHAALAHDEKCCPGDSVFDNEDVAFLYELKSRLVMLKSRLIEQLVVYGDSIPDDMKDLGMSFLKLEAWCFKKRGWDMGLNFLKVGKYQLQDGELVEIETEEVEDERGSKVIKTHLRKLFRRKSSLKPMSSFGGPSAPATKPPNPPSSQ